IERTSSTISSPIFLDMLYKSRGCFLLECTDKLHSLSHGADITILIGVIEKLIGRKTVFVPKASFLLLVEQAVFDKRFDFQAFQQLEVFLAAIPRIGRHALGNLAIAIPVLGKVGG